MTTIATLLNEARAVIPLREVRLLLQHVLALGHAELAAHPERVVAAEQATHLRALVTRREAGQPIAYLIGECEFYGRKFRVTPDVLIPRPETELLVDIAIEKLRARACRVLDLGTGSGCLAVSIAKELPQAQLAAIDASPAALAVAQDNAARQGVALRLLQSDWYGALSDEYFDLIVANPPYIAEADTHLAQGDLRFEPRGALASGPSGLDALRIIVAQAPQHLAAGGWLYVEHGYDQAQAVEALLKQAGLVDIEHRADLAGIPRVAGARLSRNKVLTRILPSV